jgi:hypothetical protein
MSELAKTLAGGAGATGPKRISIKGGVFRLIHGGKEIANIEERHLDVVIVNASKIGRIWYAKTYDADNVGGPDCWSPDGVAPSPDAANKQASRCSECPKNIAGSGQGNSRACRYQMRMAVVLANDVEGDVLQLPLPATSIFGKAEGDNRPVQEYARWLAAQNIDPEMVVTRMKFDTKSESPKLYFKTQRWLSDEEYATATEAGQSETAIKAVTMTVAKVDNVAAAAPLAIEGKRPTKAAKPPVEEVVEEAEEPAVEAAAEEEVDTPTVRKAASKKPAVGQKSSLADMVSDWDDE